MSGKWGYFAQELSSEEKRNTAETGEGSRGYCVQDRRLGTSEDACSPL